MVLRIILFDVQKIESLGARKEKLVHEAGHVSYSPRQNIWHKLKKYSKIGEDFKNVISNFT